MHVRVATQTLPFCCQAAADATSPSVVAIKLAWTAAASRPGLPLRHDWEIDRLQIYMLHLLQFWVFAFSSACCAVHGNQRQQDGERDGA